jgi:hypothetical protein
MPGGSVITLMAKLPSKKNAYRRAIPKSNYEKSFFSKAAEVEVNECDLLEVMPS